MVPTEVPAVLPVLGNLIVQFFVKGGPIMWPILICALVAVAVVGERIYWWTREGLRRSPAQVAEILGAIEQGRLDAALEQAGQSQDPVARMIFHGLNHQHTSLQGALQVAAGVELQRAGRFLTVMDTLVTLAPLLGLLGTVVGLMKSFLLVGDAELGVQAVTGGIGEALIATACGLGIAILAVVPFNYFNGRLSRLQFELETAATNVEIMLKPVAPGLADAAPAT